MTVKDLKERLKDLPDDAIVYHLDGEYKGSNAPVRDVKYYPDARWGISYNSVIIE